MGGALLFSANPPASCSSCARFEHLINTRDGADAIDLVVLDINMPVVGGFETLGELRRRAITPVLICSVHESLDVAFRCWRAGASGFVCKSSAIDVLRRAFKTVAEGGEYFQPDPRGVREQRLLDELTDRELEVLFAVLAGKSNAVIAREHSTSPRTIANQKHSMMRKLQVDNAIELTMFAMREGLLEG